MRVPTLVAAVALMASAGGAARGQEPTRPNLVLLLADDLGWTDLGAYGSRFYETPHIDRLAAEGMRFTAAYANPNCAPTRAALMTGRYGPRTGVYTVGSGARGQERHRRLIPAPNETELALEEVTFAELLEQAGYATALMGKWHLGTGDHDPERQGFDVNVAGNQTGSPRGGYFSPYDNPQLPDGPEGEHLTDRLSSEAARFIDKHAGEPFLLYLPYYSVHTPIEAKPKLVSKYDSKPPAGKHWHAAYAAMVETLDDGVGRVLDALDRNGLAERTVVIFSSDNGGVGGYADAGVDNRIEVTHNAPLRGGKGMLYEGGIRVPLIVRYPSVVAAGSTSDLPVSSVDLFSTILDLAGVEPPQDRPIDGVSFRPALAGREGTSARPPLYWHFPGYLEARAEKGAWRTTPAGAIRGGDWKLIEFFETGEIELYNLIQDVGERNDLARERPEKAAELRRELAEWRDRLEAPMPQRKDVE